jgi:37-kD nucleoid-associated bacterial protein
MDMDIHDFGTGSALALGSVVVTASDAEFVLHSRAFADRLAEAQGSRQIPGGLCAVFDGTAGYPGAPIFGVMKAELHDGFLKSNDLQAEFVTNVFLSPKTKLYKIGIFVSDRQEPRPALPDGWSATVYDSHMSVAQRNLAALYFHERFLGLTFPKNSAHHVKLFFEKTKVFIANSGLIEEKKYDLYNGLYTYLKVEQSPNVEVEQFAERFLPIALVDDYRGYMTRERVPLAAFEKDLSEISGALKLRRFRFPRRITLTGPAEALADLVTVKQIDNPDGPGRWTQITVRGPIEAQE